MERYDIFLSVIYVIDGNFNLLNKVLKKTIQVLSPIVADYEIIIIDNTSDKNKSIPVLKKLTTDKEINNLQIYALNKNIDENIAACIGLDKSLGDFVTILNPSVDDISFLPKMLDKAINSFDLVIAYNSNKYIKSSFYRFARKIFNNLYKLLNRATITKDIFPYRLFSRQITNQILQDPYPEMMLRHLPTSMGYEIGEMNYSSEFKTTVDTNFLYSVR